MANHKAIFYFNILNEKNAIYADLDLRLTGWDRKVREYLGPEWDLLVVPVVRRETGLEVLPPTPSTGRHVSSLSLLTEEEIAAGSDGVSMEKITGRTKKDSSNT